MSVPQPPAEFLSVLPNEGEAGERWLDQLPATVKRLARDWSVEVERWLPGGLSSCVLLGRRGAQAVVLKIPVRPADSERERVTLRAWGGRGAVSLLAEDEEVGAVLLPFVAGRTLAELEEPDALAAAAPMLDALHSAPAHDVPLPTTLERHESWLELVDRLWAERTDDPPVSRAQRSRADHLARELWVGHAPSERRILHGDLNPRNVVVSEAGEALAIDPFGQVGDACTDVADLALRAPGPPASAPRRVTRLARLTGRDPARVHAHAYVLAVMKVLFRLGVGAGDVDAQLAYLAAEGT